MIFIKNTHKRPFFFLCLFIINLHLFAQDTLGIYIDTIGYTVDELDPNLYHVPVRVLNLEGIASYDITIKTGAGATIDTLPDATGIISQTPNDSTLRVLYLDLTGGSLNLNDDAALFIMDVHFTGQPGDCIPFSIISFDAVHVDDPTVTVPFNATAGDICLPTIVTFSGTIMRMNTQTLDSVEVELTQGDSVYTAITDSSGAYTFEEVEIGIPATITPLFKLNEDTRLERITGINIIDLVIMSRHILENEILQSPYQLLAADVNNTENISVMDLIELQSYILNKIDAYPTNNYYRFIETAYEFPEPTNPWSTTIPTAIIIDNPATDMNELDFIGIRIGDQ